MGIALLLAAGVWVATRGSEPPAAATKPTPQQAEAAPSCANAKALYVAPDGSSQGDGSIERPLDLATALSKQGPARPCDTVWLRGGTYRGAFSSTLEGREGGPITVRQMRGERATIDSAPATDPALTVRGNWTSFRDFEVTNSDPGRVSAEGGAWPSDLKRGSGIVTTGSHLRFINLVVHDLTRGFEIGSPTLDTEVYGSLAYYNGWDGPKGAANGHGIETRNRVGTRRLIDNILFNQYSHGVIAYASDKDPTNNMTLEGNIFFNNGALSQGRSERDLLIGGAAIAQKPVLRDNISYGAAPMLVGLGAGCSDAIVENNYFASAASFSLAGCSNAVMKGNTVNGRALAANYPENTYYTERPTGTIVRVRPNQYEPGRANIAIFNWDRLESVEVDLRAAGLANGTEFEIRDVQNFFGPPVLKGVYQGAKVSLPMKQLAAAKPVGTAVDAPPHTLPEFAVFIVLPLHSPSETTASTR